MRAGCASPPQPHALLKDRARRDDRPDIGTEQGGGEVVALPEGTAERAELGGLRGGFDPFGDHFQPPRLCEQNDRAHDRGAFGVVADARDEAAVYLERIHGEVQQVAQARVAHAEIIEGEAHAKRFQGVQGAQGCARLGKNHAFGQFQLHPLGVDARFPQHLCDVRDEVRLAKIPRRKG